MHYLQTTWTTLYCLDEASHLAACSFCTVAFALVSLDFRCVGASRAVLRIVESWCCVRSAA